MTPPPLILPWHREAAHEMSDLLNWEWPHPEQSAAETIAQFDPACAPGQEPEPRTDGTSICIKCGAVNSMRIRDVALFFGHPPVYWLELQKHAKIHNADDVLMQCAVLRARADAAESRLKEAVGLLREAALTHGDVCANEVTPGLCDFETRVQRLLSTLDRKDGGHAS